MFETSFRVCMLLFMFRRIGSLFQTIPVIAYRWMDSRWVTEWTPFKVFHFPQERTVCARQNWRLITFRSIHLPICSTCHLSVIHPPDNQIILVDSSSQGMKMKKGHARCVCVCILVPVPLKNWTFSYRGRYFCTGIMGRVHPRLYQLGIYNSSLHSWW